MKKKITKLYIVKGLRVEEYDVVGKVGKTVTGQSRSSMWFGGSGTYESTPVTIQKDCNTQEKVDMEDYHTTKIDALEELIHKLTDALNEVLKLDIE